MKIKVQILILILTLSACASNKYIKFNETYSGNIFLSCLEKETKSFMSIILNTEQMIVRSKTYRFITSNYNVRPVIADNYLTEYGNKEHYLWVDNDQLFQIEKDSFNIEKTYVDTEYNYRCKRHSNYSAFRNKEERVVYAVFIKGKNKASANNLKQIKYRTSQ